MTEIFKSGIASRRMDIDSALKNEREMQIIGIDKVRRMLGGC